VVLVHYLNVPLTDNSRLCLPHIALHSVDCAHWTRDSLVSQLRPMCQYRLVVVVVVAAAAAEVVVLVHTRTHTHTRPFNGPLSRTTQVSRYQKGKTNVDFTEARDSEWQWHQLSHMQVCTSLQTDNNASTPPLSFYRPDALPDQSVNVKFVGRHYTTHPGAPTVV